MPDFSLGIIITVVSLLVALIIVVVVMRSVRGLSGAGAIANGVPATAVITSIAETGTTVSSSSTGPEAAVFRLGLRVQPPQGGAYDVEVKQAVPRLFLAMMRPGAQLAVVTDSSDPQKVGVDWSASGQLGASGAPATGPVVDAAHRGSAARLLETGVRTRATVNSATPMGITAAQAGSTDPAVANDPIYLFDVTLTMADGSTQAARFGHRVPPAKVAAVLPGSVLSVGYSPADPTKEVGIDWGASPLGVGSSY